MFYVISNCLFSQINSNTTFVYVCSRRRRRSCFETSSL